MRLMVRLGSQSGSLVCIWSDLCGWVELIHREVRTSRLFKDLDRDVIQYSWRYANQGRE